MLGTLELAGVELPDLDASRLVVQDGHPPVVSLADLSSVRKVKDEGRGSLVDIGREYCRQVLDREVLESEHELREALGSVATLHGIARELAHLA